MGLARKESPMSKYRTVRRDMLLRRLRAGRLVVKCNYHLTDDYAFDNAVGFGKSGWLVAREKKWVTDHVDENGWERGHWDFVEGMMNLGESDFEGSCGRAYRANDGDPNFVNLYVHSNLSYSLYIVPKGKGAAEVAAELAATDAAVKAEKAAAHA
jgi:hypothetical protein